MSYSARNLSVLSYANGFTLWHYKTPKTVHTVFEQDYFNDAYDLLRPGDIILANGVDAFNTHQALMLVVWDKYDTFIKVGKIA